MKTFVPPERCDSTYILTYSGKRFWPLNPKPSDIHVADIAHSLSLNNRFTGHTKCPYSVAQHSCYVMDLAKWHDFTANEQKWALMHDASEAYLHDIAAPVKRHELMENYREIERNLMVKVSIRFGLSWPMPQTVHNLDRYMLLYEQNTLTKQLLVKLPYPEPFKIEVWSWERSRYEFLSRYVELWG